MSQRPCLNQPCLKQACLLKLVRPKSGANVAVWQGDVQGAGGRGGIHEVGRTLPRRAPHGSVQVSPDYFF